MDSDNNAMDSVCAQYLCSTSEAKRRNKRLWQGHWAQPRLCSTVQMERKGIQVRSWWLSTLSIIIIRHSL